MLELIDPPFNLTKCNFTQSEEAEQKLTYVIACYGLSIQFIQDMNLVYIASFVL